jgi:hypothetical protein
VRERGPNAEIHSREEVVERDLAVRFEASYDRNGVDRSLIRYNLTKSPTERVRAVEATLNALGRLRRLTPAR